MYNLHEEMFCLNVIIYKYIYIRLKIKPNSVKIRFLSCQIFVLPSTGFELTPLIHCSLMSRALDHSTTSAPYIITTKVVGSKTNHGEMKSIYIVRSVVFFWHSGFSICMTDHNDINDTLINTHSFYMVTGHITPHTG